MAPIKTVSREGKRLRMRFGTSGIDVFSSAGRAVLIYAIYQYFVVLSVATDTGPILFVTSRLFYRFRSGTQVDLFRCRQRRI